MKDLIQVLLVEDQAMVRQGLHYIIEAQPDLSVVGEAANGDNAVQAALSKKPDVILMDIRMPGKNGIEATHEILQTLPDIKIILLTTFDVQDYVYEGIRAGAIGYLLKSAETQALLDGIREAYQGAVIYRSTSSGTALAQALENGVRNKSPQDQTTPPLEPLTEREQEVLQQMAFGRRNSEIASLLSVSDGTVKTHVHRILQKFGVEDRTQAVVIAIHQHIVH